MKRPLHRLAAMGLALFGVTALWRQAQAQARFLPRYQEPEWLRFHLSELNAGAYGEATFSESNFKNSGGSISYERLFFGPSLGAAGSGSIYHPNLLVFGINTEGALGWSQDSFRGSGVSTSRSELEFLGRFGATVDLLPGKPYRADFYVNYDHTYRDADFFTRLNVESFRYGGRFAWDVGSWYFNADYAHRDETSTSPFPFSQIITVTNAVAGGISSLTNNLSLDQHVISHEDTVSLSARNTRPRGGSTLSYNLDDYTRSDFGQLGNGRDQTLAVGDGETLGSRDQIRLNSSASYSHRDSTAELSDEVLANSNLNIEHTHTLTSLYDLNFDYFQTGTFSSENYAGSASLQHQLYESLTSTLSGHGADIENSDRNLSGYTRQYGGGFGEAYIKRLGERTRLRVNNSLFLDHTDQKTLGIIENERHAILPAGENGAPPNSFFLSVSRANLGTIVVTDVNKVVQFLAGFDYQVTPLGSRTQIEWLSPPGRPAPPAVLVSYRAEPAPPGNYETLTEGFMVRLELWNNLLGLYARGALSLNNAPFELHIQDFTTYAAGADLFWRFLRAGAEYEIYRSTDTDYNAARLFQSVAFHPGDNSTLSFDFTESLIDYLTAHRQEQDYRFITQYHHGLTHSLSLDLAAGFDLRRGQGVDQTLATVRPSVRYLNGKFSLDVGYDFEYQLFLQSEERLKHMFFLTLRRAF